MTKLPVIPQQKLAKILEKRGFVLDRINWSHHIYIHPETEMLMRNVGRNFTISLGVICVDVLSGLNNEIQ